MPQLLFDFRHQFVMSKAVIKFLSEHGSTSFNPSGRLPFIQGIWTSQERKIYVDEIYLIDLFIEDTFEHIKWLKNKKEIWKNNLKQKELFIIIQDAEILTN